MAQDPFDSLQPKAAGVNVTPKDFNTEKPYKTLKPRKLMPPVEHARKMFQQDKNKLPKNKILRFLKILFGEGF